MADMLPCPFCGGKPYLANKDMAGGAFVVCTDCPAATDDGVIETAIAVRNRRAEPADLTRLRAEVAQLVAANQALVTRESEARGVLQWAYDTLVEINPSNYDHDDVCRMNDASVEVMLSIGPFLAGKPTP